MGAGLETGEDGISVSFDVALGCFEGFAGEFEGNFEEGLFEEEMVVVFHCYICCHFEGWVVVEVDGDWVTLSFMEAFGDSNLYYVIRQGSDFNPVSKLFQICYSFLNLD